MPEVNSLQEPNLNLRITEQNGRLTVELDVPRTSGSERQVPFLEVTRNESRNLLNEAQATVISRLSQSGFQVGEVQFEAGRDTTAGVGANVPRVGKLSFEITSNGSVSGSIRNNPDVAGAIRDAESGFDRSRQGLYEQRARNWAEDGGATIRAGDGRTYTVTPEAGADYYNSKRWFPWERIGPSRADAGDTPDASRMASAPGLQDTQHPYHRQYAQALQGLEGLNVANKPDAAALLVQASANAGFDRNGELRVVAGTKDNLFAVQGEGPAGMRVAIANSEIQPGALRNVSDTLAQTPSGPSITQIEERPERVQPRTV